MSYVLDCRGGHSPFAITLQQQNRYNVFLGFINYVTLKRTYFDFLEYH